MGEQNNKSVKAVQGKILEIMKYIDALCRENGITYYIMGGTALGAVRHGGFIPWDDDLDIFMTPCEYEKFKSVFDKAQSETFVLQEWRSVPDHLEYAKVRMNGTTFIEHNFVNNRNMHHGIYVDIMILHKVPECRRVQKKIYYMSKYVTLYGISQRGWRPKSRVHAIAKKMLKILPNKLLAKKCYREIYRYDALEDGFLWCYWITKADFCGGLFDRKFFSAPVDVQFEDTRLMGSAYIKEYLSARYGDYMKLPSDAEQQASVHAEVFDTERDYTIYYR